MTLALLAALALPQESVRLAWNVKVGDRHTATLVRNYHDPSDDFRLEFTDKVETTVTAVGTRIEFEVKTTAAGLKMDGEPVRTDDKYEPTVQRETRSQRNTLVTRTPTSLEMELDHRLARILTVAFPDEAVPVGAAWRREYPSLLNGRIPAGVGNYRLTSVRNADGKRIAAIAFDFIEASGTPPMKATGTAILDLATGWLESLDAKIAETRIPGGEPDSRASLTVSLRRN